MRKKKKKKANVGRSGNVFRNCPVALILIPRTRVTVKMVTRVFKKLISFKFTVSVSRKL